MVEDPNPWFEILRPQVHTFNVALKPGVFRSTERLPEAGGGADDVREGDCHRERKGSVLRVDDCQVGHVQNRARLGAVGHPSAEHDVHVRAGCFPENVPTVCNHANTLAQECGIVTADLDEGDLKSSQKAESRFLAAGEDGDSVPAVHQRLSYRSPIVDVRRVANLDRDVHRAPRIALKTAPTSSSPPSRSVGTRTGMTTTDLQRSSAEGHPPRYPKRSRAIAGTRS